MPASTTFGCRDAARQQVGAQLPRHRADQRPTSLRASMSPVSSALPAAPLTRTTHERSLVLSLGVDVVASTWMQHGEIHAVPGPALSPRRSAAPIPASRAARTTIAFSAGSDEYEPADRHRLQQRQRAAAVIAVLMTDHQRVEARDAGRTQHRRDDAVACVGALVEARPGVVQQRVRVRLHQHREALADIEHRHPKCTERRRRGNDDEQRRKPRAGRAARRARRAARAATARRRRPRARPTAAARAAATPRPAGRSATRAAARATRRSDARRCSSTSHGTTIDASVSGTTMNVTTGIATALASGETIDICWNSTSISGISPR